MLSWKANPKPAAQSQACMLRFLLAISCFPYCSLKDTGAASALFSLMGFVHICNGLFWSDYKYSNEEERPVA